MYFIASGAVEVQRPGDEVIRLGTGEFFGEMALIMRRPRVADVVALSYCRLLMLPRDAFREFLRTHPELMQQVRRAAEERLRAIAVTERGAGRGLKLLFHVKHALLADAERGEDPVQNILDADRARDAADGPRRQPQILGQQGELAPPAASAQNRSSAAGASATAARCRARVSQRLSPAG